ncbi:coproporphyrinogen dehydrogenase HemZ [Alkaliphilus peptidifermentans]|uniref:Oxygen-independent coproporphyrinogen-3 oxidase n=1 Tax=Alkaliphilus peptidifermentans DSM 18978 TaxID=1120976 RepID=A0A1G5L2S8_9FIRM|nr:coproporphyrinogen dehydrogenase HemZ [Alkaliphilus peptidifermentans]SCZ07192.1 oxygen-independent coproporphyrinogen-3 oxidase [Alkaliphilus peptidifermentans DSM 18978]
MIKAVCIGHDYSYELNELLKLFFPSEEIEISTEVATFSNSPDKYILISLIDVSNDRVKATATLGNENKEETITEEVIYEANNNLQLKKTSKTLMKRTVFMVLKKFIDIDLPWGILTGIRPTKIVHELMEDKYVDEEIIRTLKEKYFIKKEKADLLLTVAKREHSIIYPIREDLVSLYISIPFCPTRCVYCSFPSNPLTKCLHLQQPYVDVLYREIKEIGKVLSEKGKKLETIYIGGGTPSTLTIDQMNKIFTQIKESFNLSELKEYTFEAGRPDTITREKLKTMKDNGITRISINPQTMNDCTLKTIGRNHSVQQLKEAFFMAQEEGFENINMDLIIGLPGEDTNMVEKTMKEIKELSPSSLTVHTLAVKRGSKLREDTTAYHLHEEEVAKMLEVTAQYAEEMGLNPYYMYRQKQMLGHLENIGYCKEGYQCIYNIQIMEEKQTIIALGAGAVTKVVFNDENRLERVPNVKDLQLYLDRVDEMIERKKTHI